MIRWLGLVGRSAVTVANDEMGERERESEACCRERESVYFFIIKQ
jgi:hypothetical protein